jgi:hypothetical protein
MPVARGGMNYLAVTVRDLRRSEDLFYAPVLSNNLAYDKMEDTGAMTVWYAPEARAPSTSGRLSPRAGARARPLRAGLPPFRLLGRKPRGR